MKQKLLIICIICCIAVISSSLLACDSISSFFNGTSQSQSNPTNGSSTNNNYSFLTGTWRNQSSTSHTDVWFNENQTAFKYLFQNEITGVIQRYEGSVSITNNTVTNQISITLNITSDDSSSYQRYVSFVVKSDSNGTTYLEDDSGKTHYRPNK